MMNRNERRKYQKEIKKDKRASKCPQCGYRSLFYTISMPTGNYDVVTNEDGTTENKPLFETAVKCEICGTTIYQGPDVTKLVPPGIYLPLPLDIFDYALRHPEMGEENNNDERE